MVNRVIGKDNKKPKVIPITRGRFNYAKFIGEGSSEFLGKGWSIIVEETDTRSTALTELDLAKVEHVTMLRDGETYVKGEENLRRLKASDYIRLDADIFFTLWENQYLIPESWKEKINDNMRAIFFDGTILRDSNGRRHVLCLYWGDGRWDWHLCWLGGGREITDPSAVLS